MTSRSKIGWILACSQAACCAAAAASIVSCSDAAYVGGLCAVDCGTDAAVATADACTNDACDDGGVAMQCDGGQTVVLQPVPTALYMVFDDSASLSPQWTAIVDAFDRFLTDPASQNLQLGLQLFGTACDSSTYRPLVPIAPLSTNRSVLRDALPTAALRSTSTLPSVKGALTQAQSWAATHGGKVSVVLITDGLVAECDAPDADRAQLTQAVSGALATTPSVRTFVLGFGTYPALAAIAAAGDTESTMLSSNEPALDVLKGLRSVRESAKACEFLLPGSFVPNADGWTLRGQDARALPVLGLASDCGVNPNGFFIERAPNGTTLVACPAACVELTPQAVLTLVAGCN